MVNVLKRVLVSRPGAFVDVGVNIGQTLIKVLHIDPTRTYIGFEPQVACCFLIDQFIKDNALSNARVIPLALSDRNSMLKIYSSTTFDAMASLTGKIQVDGGIRNLETIVTARILDEVFDEIGVDQVAAVKIDVEGAELQVLRGMSKTLAQKRPVLIFEVLPNFYGHDKKMQDAAVCAANTAATTSLYNLLTAANYKIFGIDSKGDEWPIEFFDLDDRLNYRGSDFIAYPA